MFRALLTTKFSSSSESESCTLFCGRGSDAGLLLVFLVGKVMATLSPVVLRPRPADPLFTFWNKITIIIRFLWFCDVQTTSKCPLSFWPWLSSACWSGSPPARCTPPPAQTPLASPVSSSCVWSYSSTTDAGLSHKWCQHTLLQLDSNPCICQLPCLRSLHQNQSYHSCHQMKRRRSPWVWAWSCDSSSNPFWSMEFGPPVSEEWQRQKSGHLWHYMIKSYICTVEKNPCIFNLKAQPGNRVLKKTYCPSLIVFEKPSQMQNLGTACFNAVVGIFIFFAQ